MTDIFLRSQNLEEDEKEERVEVTTPVNKVVENVIAICYTSNSYEQKGGIVVKHIKTISNRVLKDTMKHGGCGECQTSCQSACKTSCTVGNQSCENKNN